MMKSSVKSHFRRTALAGATAFLVVSCGGSGTDEAGPPILRVYGDQPEMRLSQMDASAGEQMTMMAQMRFEAGAELPSLNEDAPAYEITGGEPDQGKVGVLLNIFGIEGDLIAQNAQSGGGYFAGSTDGTQAALYVSGDAVQFWNYSPPWSQSDMDPACLDAEGIEPVAAPTPVTDSIVPDTTPSDIVVDDTSDNAVSSDGSSIGDDPMEDTADPCPEDGTPQNVPTEDEALQMFSDLMSDIGVDVDSLDIEVFSDSFGSSVSGFLRIGGVRSPLSWSVSYGENSRVMWAGGVLADTEKLADYPRIGTSAALDRLNEQQSALMDQMAGGDADLAASSGAGGELVVSVVEVEEELVMLYGVDESVYLVPGYAFLAEPDEFGYRPRYTVSAVSDEYIETVAPPVLDDGSTGSEPGMGEPDTGVPGTGDTDAGDMGDVMDQEISSEQANTLLGMSEAEATSTAESNGWVVRVAARDGEQFALTMDYNSLRVNLTVDGGVVTDVFIG